MKKKNVIRECPVCGGELIISKYSCTSCDTEINGSFKQDKFSLLSEDDREFMEIFVLSRGNIKEIEKIMGISYPTVRNKLDKLIKALGHKVTFEGTRLEVLEQLNNGEITLDEATEMLKCMEV